MNWPRALAALFYIAVLAIGSSMFVAGLGGEPGFWGSIGLGVVCGLVGGWMARVEFR